MSQTFHDLVWPVERPVELVDRQRQAEQRVSRIRAREDVRRRKADRRAHVIARLKTPAVIVLMLGIIVLALGVAQWLVSLI